MTTSRFFGFFEGVSGSIVTDGIVADVQFTTAGGSPTVGGPVFLAATGDDGGTGTGKLTATATQTAGHVVEEVGLCVDNANYAGAKTSKVFIQTKAPIQL